MDAGSEENHSIEEILIQVYLGPRFRRLRRGSQLGMGMKYIAGYLEGGNCSASVSRNAK